MSRAVVFTTPGLIDVRSFTTFGINAKPNSRNPIGYFGTGLKYAVAVLVRAGLRPVVWIGRDRHEFYVKDVDFRGKSFPMVRMKRSRWSLMRTTHHDLPFTTELGKNWKMWQAFRELESNTRDEGGITEIEEGGITEIEELNDYVRPVDRTTIVVEGEEFVQAYLERDNVFLPGGLSEQTDDSGAAQVLEGASKFLYYRGMRVAELDKPSLFTYNVLAPIELTEDRTCKYAFQPRENLAKVVVTSTDAEFIERIVLTDDGHWEHGLEFDYQSERPSDEFRALVRTRRGAMPPAVTRYYAGWRGDDRAVYDEPETTWDRYPRPWQTSNGGIQAANGRTILERSPALEADDQMLQDVVDIVNKAEL
jgi:hypothetical protein